MRDMRLSVVLVGVVLVFAACGTAHPRHTTPANRPPNSAWNYVPHDTAFVYATVVPFAELPWAGNDAGYGALGRRVHELEVQGVDARRQLPEMKAKMLLALELLGQDYTIDGSALDRLGVGAQSRLLIYGAGANPIGRVEVAKPKLVRSHLLALFERLELSPKERLWQNKPYWEFSAANYSVLVALSTSELSAALVWIGEPEEVLPAMMAPAVEPVDRTSVFESISERTTLADYVGYVDSAESIRVLLRVGEHFPKGATKTKTPQEREVCATEWGQLVSAVPRVWLSGSASEDSHRGLIFTDLRPDWVQALRKMIRPVPLDEALRKAPVGSFSMGLDVGRALGHTRNALASFATQTYACKELKELAEQAPTWSKSVQGVSLTPLAGFSGLAGLVKEYQVDPRGNLEVKGFLTVAHASPAALFNLLRLVPGATLPDSLKVGAVPVRFFLEELSSLGPTDVGVGKTALGVTVGMGKELTKALAGQGSEKPVLFHMWLGPALFDEPDEDQADVEGVYDPGLASALVKIDEGSIVVDVTSVEVFMEVTSLGVELRYELRAASGALTMNSAPPPAAGR